MTTLHGTDITLVGSDPSFLPLTRFSIVESDAVTAPSAWLAEATLSQPGRPARPRDRGRSPTSSTRERFAPAADARARADARPAVLVHVSNFRSLKRVDDVVAIFAEARAARPSAR